MRFTLLLSLAACTATVSDTGDTADTSTAPDDTAERADIDPSDTPECVDDDGCELDDFCDDGVCSSVWGRRYAIRVASVRVAADKPDGKTWDPLGDDPDPYYELSLNGTLVRASEPQQNQRDITWLRDSEAVFTNGGSIEVGIYDDDLAVDDEIIVRKITDGSLRSLLRRGETTLSRSGSAAEVTARRVD